MSVLDAAVGPIITIFLFSLLLLLVFGLWRGGSGAGDDEVPAEELFVVLPVAHTVVGHVVEHLAEDVGVGAGRVGPGAPEAVGERVLDGAVGGGAPVVVLRVARHGRPVARRPVAALVGEPAEVLAEEVAAEGGGEARRAVRTAVHGAVDQVLLVVLLDDDGDFRVVRAELRAVVEVRRAADHEPVVGDQDLGVDVQLLRYEGVHLGLLVAVPGDAADVRPAVHVACAHRVPGVVGDAGRRGLVPVVLVAVAPVVAPAYEVVVLAARVVVADAAPILGLTHRRGGVDAVVVAEVVESDVAPPVVHAVLLQAFDDAMTPAPIDAVVLIFHDGTGAKCAVRFQIAGERWDGRHENYDTEVLAVRMGADNT